MPGTQPEAYLQAAIRLALGLEEGLALWLNPAGIAEHTNAAGRSQRTRYGVGKGGADLIGVLGPTGRFVALEVKTESGRLKPHQAAWLALVRKLGGFACVVRSVGDARAAIARARQGACE